jgi:phage baseplate assembly protein W
MIGMNKTTGRRIDGIDHIKQSINDILITPIGSSLMNREYGSLLSELIDHPTNDANTLRLMSATVMAVSQWEPRVAINQVGVVLGEVDGELIIDLAGSYADVSGRIAPMSLNVQLGGLR